MRERRDEALRRLAELDPASGLTRDPHSDRARAVLAGAIARADAMGEAGRSDRRTVAVAVALALTVTAAVAIVVLAFATRVQGGTPRSPTTYAFAGTGAWPQHGHGASASERRAGAAPQHELHTAPPPAAGPPNTQPATRALNVAPPVGTSPPRPLIATMSPGVGVTANSGVPAPSEPGAAGARPPSAVLRTRPKRHRRTKPVGHHSRSR
jgi:hypothetical protein